MSDTEEQVAAGAPASADGAAEKPVRRRRTRKAAEAEAPAAPEAAAADAAAVGEAAEKPRRRTRKAAAKDQQADAAAAPEAAAAEGEATEKPRRRTRTAKKAAPADGGEAAQAAPAAAKPQDAEAAAPAPAAANEPAAGKGEGDQPARQERQQRRNRDQRDRNAGGQNQQKGQNKQRDRRNRRRQHEQRNREVVPSVTREELAEMKVAQLREKAAELELDVKGMKKAELVEAIFVASAKAEGFIDVEGVLDVLSDGYGFLRTSGYLPGETDVYVGASLIRRNGLRKGDYIKGKTRPARENEKFAAIQKIDTVNDVALEDLGKRVRFADLTPVYPDERLWMEHGKNTITARVIDLCAPIGKGQRGLIVSPPKAGKTTILKDIAASITANNPEVHLMCLLVDERPEEVTDMERSIKGEVISSTFDMPCENHIAVAEMVIERAKRLVETGQDVVILLDSLTRLARAYNLAQPASGRILSGGVDSTALYPPKKFLGAARNIENGGSLTILASALVETGSKMDEVIFEEFKGTGNMELKLDRSLSDRRIFPAIDPVSSGTRKEDLLLLPQEAPLIWGVRRILSNANSIERAMDMLIKSIKQTNTNVEFLMRTAKKAQTSSKMDEIDL